MSNTRKKIIDDLIRCSEEASAIHTTHVKNSKEVLIENKYNVSLVKFANLINTFIKNRYVLDDMDSSVPVYSVKEEIGDFINMNFMHSNLEFYLHIIKTLGSALNNYYRYDTDKYMSIQNELFENDSWPMFHIIQQMISNYAKEEWNYSEYKDVATFDFKRASEHESSKKELLEMPIDQLAHILIYVQYTHLIEPFKSLDTRDHHLLLSDNLLNVVDQKIANTVRAIGCDTNRIFDVYKSISTIEKSQKIEVPSLSLPELN